MNDVSAGTTALIAVGLVPLVSLIKRPSWSARVNYAVGMVASIIAATVGTVLDSSNLTARDWVTNIFVGLGSAQTVYMLYFRETGVNDDLTNSGNQ